MKRRPRRPAALFVLPVLTTMAVGLVQSAPEVPTAEAQATGGTGGTTGTGGTGGTSLALADFQYRIFYKNNPMDEDWVELLGTERERFFSQARCQCDTPVLIQIGVAPTSRDKVRSLTDADLRLRVGDQSCYCSTPANCEQQKCVDLSTNQIKLSELINGPANFETTAKKLFEAPGTGGEGCRRRSEKQAVYMVARINADEYSDITDGIIEVQLDGQAPPQPTNLKVRGGNEALSVSWDAIDRAAVSDLQGYVVFCSRNDSEVWPENQRFDPLYNTPQTLCQAPATTTSALLAAGQTAPYMSPHGSDGKAVVATPPFIERRKSFACTDVMSGTSTRLFRLQNFITYLVGVASVDDRGNISDIEQVVAQQPNPTVDFYRDYRADGGTATGGFCSLGRGRAPAGSGLGLTLLAVAVTLGLRRRRRS